MNADSFAQSLKAKLSKEDYTDPRQQRLVECDRLIRTLRAERREIKRQLEMGLCEVCGKEFRRARVTRRYCGPVCNSKAWVKRGNQNYDIEAIRESLPLLRAGRVMSTRSLDVLEVFLNREGPFETVAEEVDLTRQRVQQIVARANRLAPMALAMKAAVNA